jgi:hypothetical protein
MNAAINFVARTKYEWFKWFIAMIIWISLGCLGSEIVRALFAPPAVINDTQPTLISINKFYLGLVIDRTRNTYCDVHPQHVLLSHIIINGKSERVVFPLLTPDFVYPTLGEQRFVVPILIPQDLPSGQWYIQTVAFDNCNWLTSMFSNSVRISKPLEFTIPYTGQ